MKWRQWNVDVKVGIALSYISNEAAVLLEINIADPRLFIAIVFGDVNDIIFVDFPGLENLKK
jgi:hypothetical protein